MEITLNGEKKTFDKAMTITDLLGRLSIHHDRVAVEVNLRILDRHEFQEFRVSDGDRVEIISFMGGGC